MQPLTIQTNFQNRQHNLVGILEFFLLCKWAARSKQAGLPLTSATQILLHRNFKKIKAIFPCFEKCTKQHLNIDFKPTGVIGKYCICEHLLSRFSEKELLQCQCWWIVKNSINQDLSQHGCRGCLASAEILNITSGTLGF